MAIEGQGGPVLASSRAEGFAGFLDREALLKRVFGNVPLLQELIRLFFEEYPTCLAEIRQAIRLGNAPALRQAAHLLRGSVGNFGPSPVYEAAGRLEHMGRTGNLDDAEAAYFNLDRALHQLQPLLAGMALEPVA